MGELYSHKSGMIHNYGNTFEYDISYILENPQYYRRLRYPISESS